MVVGRCDVVIGICNGDGNYGAEKKVGIERSALQIVKSMPPVLSHS